MLLQNKNDFIEAIIKKYINTIFSYSIKRTNNRDDAEDLAQDILAEIISSYKNIKNIQSYNSWIWSLANNTYKRWLKNHKKNQSVCINDMTANEIYNFTGYNAYMEYNVIKNDELNKLRREISILSDTYRNIIVMHYIEEKSCNEIAQKLKISCSMVKYFLFKARKNIKEGIDMERKFGKKSYNPSNFVIRFWGDNPSNYFKIFERKLPGNILLSASDRSVSISDLSIETGVPVIYLDDELDILERYELIKSIKGHKYQTNIIIITKKINNMIDSLFSKNNKSIADEFNDYFNEHESDIRNIKFWGSNFDKNKLLWLTSQIVLLGAITVKLMCHVLPSMPLLASGNHGWVYGSEKIEQPWSCGITPMADDESNQLYMVDYCILNRDISLLNNSKNLKFISHLNDSGKSIKDLNDEEKETAAYLISNGLLIKNNETVFSEIPIFTKAQYNDLKLILNNLTDYTYKYTYQIFNEIHKILNDEVPEFLYEQLIPVSFIESMDVMGNIMQALYSNHYISIPDENFKNSLSCYIVLN